jgi:hypothetical protein|tara:strand:+ start:318 stop:500 length:183 start_codon:yes stop_codon:yes gene_type:complete
MELTKKELGMCREAITFLLESITDDFTCKVMNENIKEELALISKIDKQLEISGAIHLDSV